MTRVVNPVELLLPRRKERIDAAVAGRVRGLTLVLEHVHDPHNLAAVLRTAEGLGVQDIHVIQSPKGFRPNAAVTQGADKWLDVTRHKDVDGCVAHLRGHGYALFGSMLTGAAVDVEALPIREKLALVFGNEHAGISAPLAARCQGFFRIPMAGFAQSFNISVAVGITLGIAMLERRRAGLAGDLTADEQTALKERFYALSADLPDPLP